MKRLTHYHTMPHFDALNMQISPFLIMFSSIYYGTYFSLQIHFKRSSAICFNLDQSKILSSGNGLIKYEHCSIYTKAYSLNAALNIE